MWVKDCRTVGIIHEGHEETRRMTRIQNIVVLFLLILVTALLQDRDAIYARQDAKQADSIYIAVTFQQSIAPLLKANCKPCHYEGGTVVGKYPFEDYKTVKKLGEKLNTRLKEKEQQSLIVEWLKTGAKEK